jgi:MFS family permease
MLAVFAVAQFFAGPVMGNIADRFGRRPVLIIARGPPRRAPAKPAAETP